MGDSMSRRVYRVAFVCLLAVLAMGSSRVYGQGGTTSTLSGTVVDGSGAVLPGADVAVKIERAAGQKCERCWKYTTDVGSDAAFPTICGGCAEAVKEILHG